jgi:hypothetical protein
MTLNYLLMPSLAGGHNSTLAHETQCTLIASFVSLEINPMGKVPVIVDGRFKLFGRYTPSQNLDVICYFLVYLLNFAEKVIRVRSG